MKAREFTKNFFNLDAPTTSSFQNIDWPRRVQRRKDLDEYGQEGKEVDNVTDLSAWDFQSQGY